MKKILSFLLLNFAFLIVEAQIPSYVPTNGLVAWYPFNGNANDESGNGHNGNIISNSNGSIAFIEDRFGKSTSAIQFNGNPNWNSINTYIDVTNSNTINFSASYTLNLFINVDSNCQVGQIISKGGDRLLAFGVRYHPTIIGIGSAAGGFGAPSSQFVSEWKMITITRDESANFGHFYINGILIDSSVIGATNINNANLWFGAHNEMGVGNGSMYPYIGMLDDISLYNRALSRRNHFSLHSSSAMHFRNKQFNSTGFNYNKRIGKYN